MGFPSQLNGDNGQIALYANGSRASDLNRMKQVLAVLLLTITPALAWEPLLGGICEPTYDSVNASVRVTHDPAVPAVRAFHACASGLNA